jgi:hypothetical protein
MKLATAMLLVMTLMACKETPEPSPTPVISSELANHRLGDPLSKTNEPQFPCAFAPSPESFLPLPGTDDRYGIVCEDDQFFLDSMRVHSRRNYDFHRLTRITLELGPGQYDVIARTLATSYGQPDEFYSGTTRILAWSTDTTRLVLVEGQGTRTNLLGMLSLRSLTLRTQADSNVVLEKDRQDSAVARAARKLQSGRK